MGKRVRKAIGLVVAAVLFAGAAPAVQADDYESDRAGHPVRIVAYLVHPIGVVLDYLLLRPVHWLGHQEPFKTLFGHEDE